MEQTAVTGRFCIVTIDTVLCHERDVSGGESGKEKVLATTLRVFPARCRIRCLQPQFALFGC